MTVYSDKAGGHPGFKWMPSGSSLFMSRLDFLFQYFFEFKL